jgi:hypothetical protein
MQRREDTAPLQAGSFWRKRWASRHGGQPFGAKILKEAPNFGE